MHVAIRADGGPSIGFGHLVRTGALAETVLRDGNDVTYLTRTPEAVENICPDEANIVELQADDIDAASKWIDDADPTVVLTDNYDVDTDDQRTIRSVANASSVVLDDTRYTVCADYVINGNVYAPNLEYEWIDAEPTWYLGTDFLLIRKAIRRQAENPEPFRKQPDRAVVTMGGSDIRGSTPAVIRAFDGVDISIDIIIGPGFENHDEIQQAVSETDARCELHEAPQNFPELISRADIAVSAAGSTTYELLAVGTPTIAIPQADNQKPIARALEERSAVVRSSLESIDSLSDQIQALLEDTSYRHTLRSRGREIVDCRGPERIYQTVCQSET